MGAGGGACSQLPLCPPPPSALSSLDREAVLISAKCDVATSKVTGRDSHSSVACTTPKIMKRPSPKSGSGEARGALMVTLEQTKLFSLKRSHCRGREGAPESGLQIYALFP